MNDFPRWPTTFCVLTLLANVSCSSSSSAPTCGAQAQACCNGVACDNGLVCLSEVCTAPAGSSGTTSGATGSGSTTGRAATSSSSTSSSSTSGGPACGGASQTCCAGDTCNGSLVCQAGSCIQPQSGVAGTPCTKNSDCPTGICLPVGQPTDGQPAGEATWTGNVCSTTCTSASSCVAGWSCGALAGQSSNVCQCSYSSEVCDGKDNDCDGIVDDEPKVDDTCASQMGVGASCQNGSCVCGGGTTRCGESCANTQTDPSNCGGCAASGGQACATAQACSSGSCVCPTSGQTFCAGTQTCSDTQVDPDNCGGCAGAGGMACAAGESCVAGACACEHTVCNGTCANTDNDPANCGGCGQTCGQNIACVAGVCCWNDAGVDCQACGTTNFACEESIQCCSESYQPFQCTPPNCPAIGCQYNGQSDVCACMPSYGGNCWRNSDCCSNMCVFADGQSNCE